MTSTSPEATAKRVERETAERGQRVAVAIANPAAFGEIYVRPYDPEWRNHLPDVALEMLAFIANTRRGVIITPPEFLKTTIVSQLYPLFLTARYAQLGAIRRLSGMLFSESSALAEKNLGVVAWHIEHNRLIARDFVDQHGRRLLEPDPDEDKWTDSSIVVRRPGAAKDPTWDAKGLNSGEIQGARLRHLIGDDVVTPGSATSPARQREAKRLWDVQMVPRVLEDGQAVIAGNFNHPTDLVSSIAGRAAYRVLRRPSLHVKGDRSTPPKDPRDPEAVVTLPERWPRERLLRELSAAPGAFPAVHLLRASNEGGDKLRTDWVSLIARSDVPRKHRILFGLDPAPGAEVDPDPSFFNLTVGALSDRHLDVVESIALRMDTAEQVEMIGRFARRYWPIAGIGVAKIALDRYFKGAALVGHPWLRPFFHGHSIPGDKSTRLSGLGAYAKSGWLRVVESTWTAQTSDVDDRPMEESLAEQWAAFPQQNHDDRLDGLDLLIREALTAGGAPTVVTSAVPNGAMGAAPASTAPSTPTMEGAELSASELLTRDW